MATLKTTILDLNDDCLHAIFERLPELDSQQNFSRTCDRFAKIYCNHYIHHFILCGYDDHILDGPLLLKFCHLIGTKQFPFKDINTIILEYKNSQMFSKRLLQALKESNPNVENATLYFFRNSGLKKLLPLPKLKRLHLKCGFATGIYIDQLRNLEELHLENLPNFESRHFINIAKQNKLQTLLIRCCPFVFSRIHAMEMVRNLNNLRELEVDWDELRKCQSIGNLPCLKDLVINNFKTYQCDVCRRFNRGHMPFIKSPNDLICKCGFYQARALFRGLHSKNILEKLTFFGSRLTTKDLTFVSKLSNLKSLHMLVDNGPIFLPITILNSLKELQEINMGFSWKLPKEVLRFLEECPNLKYVHFGNSENLSETFLLKAIEVIKRRAVTPVEPVKLQFMNPDFTVEFQDDERIKAAKKLIQLIVRRSKKRKSSSIGYTNFDGLLLPKAYKLIYYYSSY